jgi:hypothetical protein
VLAGHPNNKIKNMQQILNEEFEFEGENYAIRGVFTGSEILVRAFQKNRPVSPLATMSFETALGVSSAPLKTATEILCQWCKEFVTGKKAEQYLEAVKQLREHSEFTEIEEPAEDSSIPTPTEEDFQRYLRTYSQPPK